MRVLSSRTFNQNTGSTEKEKIRKESNNFTNFFLPCEKQLNDYFIFWINNRVSVLLFACDTELFGDPVQNALGDFIFAEQRQYQLFFFRVQ